MKKLSIAAAAALALASAAPAIAQENTVAADPFVSTQNTNGLALGVVGGAALLVLIASADSSSGTD